MAQDQVYADLLDALSPLTAAGIDPDEARMDRAGTMAKLMPDDDAQPSWADKARQDYEDQQQQAAPAAAPQDDGTPAPAPQLSPNGNPLPPGLNSRQPQPTPAVPASVTPTGDASTPSLADRNSRSIDIMETNLERASNDVQNEAAQPDLATQTKTLEQMRANAQARQVADENPYDPKTGKMRAEYKPSFGQRLVRGVEGFAGGGVIGLLDPQVGGAKPYGAPNKQFGIDQQQDAGRVAGADQQLANAAANYKATSERLAKVASDRRAVATTGKDVTGASIAQQDIPIKQETADNASPDAAAQKLKDAYTQRVADADAQGLKGPQRTFAIINGKIPDPKQSTAEEIALGQATAAWHHDNPNKQPGLNDVRDIASAARGSEIKGAPGKPIPPALQNKILDEKKAAMDAATTMYRDGHDKDQKTFGQSDWVAAMQDAQDKFEAAIEAQGGSTNHMTIGPDGQWTADKTTTAASGDAWDGLEPPKQGEVAVISPEGTKGYATEAWLKTPAAKGFKRKGAK